jgi:hypothetical protein
MPSDTVLPGPTQDLAHSIEIVIRTRTSGLVRGLHVLVLDDGEVVITGRTTTYYAKQLATHAALEVCDDRILTNDIEVL